MPINRASLMPPKAPSLSKRRFRAPIHHQMVSLNQNNLKKRKEAALK
jgi:hypothetical protein